MCCLKQTCCSILCTKYLAYQNYHPYVRSLVAEWLACQTVEWRVCGSNPPADTNLFCVYCLWMAWLFFLVDFCFSHDSPLAKGFLGKLPFFLWWSSILFIYQCEVTILPYHPLCLRCGVVILKGYVSFKKAPDLLQTSHLDSLHHRKGCWVGNFPSQALLIEFLFFPISKFFKGCKCKKKKIGTCRLIWTADPSLYCLAC